MVTGSIPQTAQTPMMRQFLSIKEGYTDALLFFRLGDFYELFFDDAIVAANTLDLTLTGRGKGDNRVPMCGVPHHAAENYVSKLVNAGYKVAICEQVEEAQQGKGITKREVVRVLTPATYIGSHHTQADTHVYLAAVSQNKYNRRYGVAFIDPTTGHFYCTRCNTAQELQDFLKTLAPKECLVSTALTEPLDLAGSSTESFDALPEKQSCSRVQTFFGIQSLGSFGLANLTDTMPAVWAIIAYLKHTQKDALQHITRCSPFIKQGIMHLDPQTIRNLELFKPLNVNATSHSLFATINYTKSAAGARLLKQWLLHPLTEEAPLLKRYAAVESLAADVLSREEIREQLRQLCDIERVLTRCLSLGQSPRDVVALRDSLVAAAELGPILAHFSDPLLTEQADYFQTLHADNHPFKALCALIDRAIPDPAPATIAKCGLIAPGYNAELDALIRSFKDITDWIAGLEKQEQERTGIKQLRVGFNSVFGYYFQVSKGQSDHVPSDYIRKQTLTHAERYITPELKEKETILLTGQDKQLALEQALFADLLQSLATHIDAIKTCVSTIATLDCLQGFATLASKYNYCKPTLTQEPHCLELYQSRHPLLEKNTSTPPVPNDICLSADTPIAIITGPNMAGKSTLMKQVALSVILAQIGSFVPASAALIGLVDRCFTRIGASDDLSSGSSTFMVEMTETATILHHATANSLILLDEIGRGTSTYDGLSIAAAVLEYITHHIQARTLFATHYHELTGLFCEEPRVCNLSMAIIEENNQLSFTYTLQKGPADKSYGIHVAQMAGLPQHVTAYAQQLLAQYEDAAR